MKKFAAAFGLLALAACSTDQPPATVAVTTPPQKIYLNVQSIGLADRSSLQSANSPYNTNNFTPTIADSVKGWAKDHLQASGSNGQALVVIKDAALTSTPLPVKSGMDNWFTRQQGVKYTGKADVTVEANGAPGFATAEASATRSVTLPENPTAIEKQDAYYNLMKGLMKDLDTNLQGAIATHMGTFMTGAPAFGNTAMPVSNSGITGVALPPAPPADAPVQPGMDNATSGM